MVDKKKKTYLKHKLIKFKKPLDEVTLCQCDSPCKPCVPGAVRISKQTTPGGSDQVFDFKIEYSSGGVVIRQL
jgi:hypothetical protein